MSPSTNSTVYIPPMIPVSNSNGGPQAPSPAVGQSQSHDSHPHVAVPGAQGLSSPTWTVPLHGNIVGQQQQQPIPHGYTGAFNAGGNLANANAGPTALVAPPEMNGDEWTGTLYCPLSGACQARARGTEAVGNLYAPAFLKGPLVGADIHLERYQRGQSICNLNLALIPNLISKHGSVTLGPLGCR
jgi:hypothetical protein